ncbi:DNA repair protein RecN [Propioniciclava soli]|uniref:DNA repair protein RecN n=1 Tax=Propioniciclava soli TaxID=2775081 RepID=UPI001E2A0BC4|nr:DNA repair protein RecN [Propioniciclava soli]
MLTELRIADLGVIDDAVVEFGPGFTVVTGETGAGKTMVVSGLGLLLGGRADTGLVRIGASRALVEGRVTTDEAFTASVGAVGGVVDGDEVLLTRVVTSSRSRARVGGVQVPLPLLADVVGERITIHGQSEQLRLGSTERQRDVLDAFVGPGHLATLASYRTCWARRRAATAELAELRTQARARAREQALLEFGLGEIAKAEPRAGEDEELHAEARRLQATDDLRLAARAALVALAGDDDAVDDAPQALGLLGAARRALAGGAAEDAQLAALGSRVDEAAYALGDVAGELASYLASLDADPGRLEWIAGRLAELQGLTRRYGPGLDDVLAWAERAAIDLERLAGSDDRIAELEAAVAACDSELAALAATLTQARRDAAAELGRLVEEELVALAMPRARLEFAVTSLDAPGPQGADQVTILFSANPGSAPAPLARAASGGELSRVRLALEVVLAAGSEGHTFVFDEVDAGVGGAVALEIGRRLARLARHAQVVVVTHLAQVAAFGDRHHVVHKADDGQVTTSGIREVSGDERVAELARMMAGLEGTQAARAHAAELLAEASGQR